MHALLGLLSGLKERWRWATLSWNGRAGIGQPWLEGTRTEASDSWQVKYWRTALPVLRAYQHVPSFQAVEAEASDILVQLKEKLRVRLNSLDSPASEVCVPCTRSRAPSASFRAPPPSALSRSGLSSCGVGAPTPRHLSPLLTSKEGKMSAHGFV